MPDAMYIYDSLPLLHPEALVALCDWKLPKHFSLPRREQTSSTRHAIAHAIAIEVHTAQPTGRREMILSSRSGSSFDRNNGATMEVPSDDKTLRRRDVRKGEMSYRAVCKKGMLSTCERYKPRLRQSRYFTGPAGQAYSELLG